MNLAKWLCLFENKTKLVNHRDEFKDELLLWKVTVLLGFLISALKAIFQENNWTLWTIFISVSKCFSDCFFYLKIFQAMSNKQYVSQSELILTDSKAISFQKYVSIYWEIGAFRSGKFSTHKLIKLRWSIGHHRILVNFWTWKM